jgi:DNA repair exonuclease SbcCD ATPase subunit
MVLKQLELFRFKRFLKKTITFAPGLNIIRGPNEAGKSTLRAALTTVLFGNPTSNSEAVRALTTWGQTERCELRLEYSDDEKRLCQLRKDFATNKIFMLRDEESLRTLKGIQNQITEELGIPSEDMFNLCTSLDVRSLSNLGSQASRKQIGKMLAGLMTGTSSGPDVLQALKRLEEAIRELGKGERAAAVKNPGPLKMQRDQLLVMRGRLEQERKALNLYQDRLQQFEKLRGEIEVQQSRKAGLGHLMEANTKLQTAKTRKQELVIQDTDFEKRMQEHKKLETELEALTQILQQDVLNAFTAEEINHLRSLQQRQHELEKDEPKQQGNTSQSPWLWGLGALLGLVGLSLLFFEWAVAILVLLSSAGIIITGVIQQSSEKEKQLLHQKELDKWQDKMQLLKSEIDAMGNRAGTKTVDEILLHWPQTQQRQMEKTSLQKRLESFLPPDDERWQTIRRELRLLADVLSDPSLNTLALAPEALAERQTRFRSWSRTLIL